MTATVMMLVIGWVIQSGEIHEAWRIEREASLETCLQMNQLTMGGKAGVFTVRCAPIKPQKL